MKRERVLIVEDEPDILDVIDYNLTREGYRTVTAADGAEGLRKARQEAPELVILDLMLPGMDGLEVCRRLKEDPVTRGIAVMMVTAKGEESDVVLGLGLGADDYVTKPFRPKELVARVRSVLRRGTPRDETGDSERIVVGDLVVDSVRHVVQVAGKTIDLTPTEFRLLKLLAGHPGRVFTREMLLGRVIDEHAIVLPRNIDVHVRSIRRKLGEARDLIETVRGVGYRFGDRGA